MAKHFQRKGRKLLGIDLQGWIKGFFSSNAALSIVILFLICFFLIVEAVRFFPQHHKDLQLYRKSGQEYVGHIITEMDEYTKLVSLTNQAYFQELNDQYKVQRGVSDSFEAFLDPLEDDGEDFIEALEDAEDDPIALEKAKGDWRNFVTEIVEKVDRSEIDSFDRLDDASWAALKKAMVDYDPIEEESPAYVLQAQQELKQGMADFEAAKSGVVSAGSRLKSLRGKLVGIAAKIKEDATAEKSAEDRKAALLAGAETMSNEVEKKAQIEKAEAIVIREDFPFAERTKEIAASKDEHRMAVAELKEKLSASIALLPEKLGSPQASALIDQVRTGYPKLVEKLDVSAEKAAAWQWDDRLGFFGSTMKFFFGSEWVTNSSWHDFYGLLPLFTGSFLISIIALTVAVPFSIGAAIYVNRLASKFEQTIIKPAIELIQAIPSVVLGFFGIMVLGEGLRELSQIGALSWIPGFPMQERLNILNAGLLLALMAVPTIFTLCEDALNNVPKAYNEASLALGASKLQTIIKVIVPTAISGILAAVLLGFGRVIGETMVVLLVAGNKISLPDWTAGFGVVTQPTHTMTGIIAQEMGEVSEGTLHFRALFLVGLVLFTISLCINVAAQRIIKRLGHAGTS
ncbi:phosphate ABC transporter permease subunit PstC [bacterium]|nr:phosphate ABC transporter permease subunit PstC [bacterium]MDB4546382.1 phosphate ABC transporter permease subunit PstC [Akkermansiaceae bacterium]